MSAEARVADGPVYRSTNVPQRAHTHWGKIQILKLGCYRYRNHYSGYTKPFQEPWCFGKEVESVCKRYIELRYQLQQVVPTQPSKDSQALKRTNREGGKQERERLPKKEGRGEN